MAPTRLDRRHFLGLLGATAAASAMPAVAAPSNASFSFIFITDCHLEPELDGIRGTDLAMKRARTMRADFAIQGGDHIFDSLAVAKPRALALYDQYDKVEQDLGLEVHHTLGNHDVFGIYAASGTQATDPLYGKKLFADRFGPTFYSFNHKRHHFIVLDSIGIAPNPGGNGQRYEARIDDEQLAWLAADLAKQPAGTPIIVTTHIPLVTAMSSYTVPDLKGAAGGYAFHNGPAAIKLLEGHNVLAVLQGHTHINERVEWRGIPYITSGAVCGNWWHGIRLGTPEGFTVVTIVDSKLTTRYEVTGFKSVDPQNT